MIKLDLLLYQKFELVQRLKHGQQNLADLNTIIQLNQQLNTIEENHYYLKLRYQLEPSQSHLFDYIEWLENKNELKGAVQILLTHLTKNSGSIDIHLRLSKLYLRQQEIGLCRVYLNHALKNSPSTLHHYIAIAEIYQGLKNYQQAEHYLWQARSRYSYEILPVINLGYLLEIQGKQKDAYQLLSGYQSQLNTNISFLNVFCTVCRRLQKASEALELMNSYWAKQNPSLKNISLVFQTAWLYDIQRDFKSAIYWFNLGNRLHPATYNPVSVEEKSHFIQRAFSSSWLKKMSQNQSQTKLKLIFIVGMPRSGTSLAEQILSSHPHVQGGGELSLLQSCFEQFIQTESPFESPHRYPTEHLKSIANSYLNKVEQIYNPENKLYFTDKMPENFWYLFLIELLFPEAYIIHCQRNPLSTSLSCYFQYFSHHHNAFSYSFQSLSHYYRQYTQIMDFWSKNLSKEIFNISYESLVDSPRSNIKNLLSFCDLEWDDRCLNFHKNPRIIQTASYYQVKQELYRSSLNHADNYLPWVQELSESLSI